MWGYWLFIAIESLIMKLLRPAEELAFSEPVYLGLIIFNIFVLLITLVKKYSKDGLFVILISCGLFLRVFFMIWSEYYNHIFTLPNAGADELTYYYNAMSNLVKDKTFTGYSQFFAWQANIYGLSKIFGKFINVLFSISAIVMFRKTLITLNISENIRTKVLALACVLPNFAILSSLLLRESIIIFFVSVSVYFFAVWWKKNRMIPLLCALVSTLGAAWLHSGMIAYTLGILCIAIASKRGSDGRKYSLPSIRTLVLTVLTSVIALVIVMNLGTGLTSYFRGADSLEDIVAMADAYEDGGSSYNANIVSNDTTLGFIINTPVRMLYFLFAPLPWNWRNSSDAIAFLLSGLFYGYVFFKSIPLVFTQKRNPLISGLFLIALLVLMMFGWGVSNSGTALRHRDKMVIHYLLLYALMSNVKNKQSNRSETGQ